MPNTAYAALHGVTCAAWLGEPNEQIGHRLTVALKTDIQRGETDRETRSMLWQCPRYTYEVGFTVTEDIAADLRTWIVSLGQVPSVALAAGNQYAIALAGDTDWAALGAPSSAVGTVFQATAAGSGTGQARLLSDAVRLTLPLWWAEVRVGDWASRRIDAGVWVNRRTGALTAAPLSGALSTDWIVPCLVGRVDELPKLQAIEELSGDLEIELIEDAPWEARIDWRLAAPDLRTWPASLEPVDAILSERTVNRTEWKELGQGRQGVAEGQSAPSRWRQDGRLVLDLDGPDLGNLVSHFIRHGGRYLWFDAPAWIHPHTTPTQATPDAYRCRFAEDELQITFYADRAAEADVRLLQLPWELNLPGGEAPERPSTAWLYEITYQVPVGGWVRWRLTSCERALTYASATWTPAAIEHDEIVHGRGFAASEVQIKAGPIRHASGDPFQILLLGRAEAPLRLVLTEVEVGAGGVATNGIVRYTGDLAGASARGALISVRAGEAKQSKAPRIIIQREDNRNLFTEALNPATYALTGTVIDIWDGGLKIFVNRTGGIALPAPGYFVQGWAEFGSGLTFQRRGITVHYDETGFGYVPTRDLSVTVSHPFRGLAAGAEIKLFPGYDRRWDTARGAAFGGAAKAGFMGFPFVPLGKPDDNAPDFDPNAPAKGTGK